jgi:phosphatidylserine/phosphatidylglycerophosphate/cardiolipin synthase-like enzyme
MMHAKCAVADEDILFVSSANLTEFALTINMEMGILIRDGYMPGMVVRHFEALVQEGTLVGLWNGSV